MHSLTFLYSLHKAEYSTAKTVFKKLVWFFFFPWHIVQTRFWGVSYWSRDDTAEILAFIFSCQIVTLLLNLLYWKLSLSFTDVVKSLNTCPEVWSYIPASYILNFFWVSCCIALCIKQSFPCIFTFYEKKSKSLFHAFHCVPLPTSIS